ncbi:MAG TPA: leishmanolysin-related zinc metalloendopeptidase [Gemmatimonas sp.]|uniref:leishmanolysin-related zinc metalloendopeptidase n=1 Tax=Gemmatimonas sp. TaxID=1962908 RepID=UPI002EDB5566
MRFALCSIPNAVRAAGGTLAHTVRAITRLSARTAAGVASVAALTMLAACGDDPQVPTEAVPTGSLTANATVATAVGAAPSVRITDAKGKGIRNVLVRWRVASGGGRVVNDSIRTNASGEASSGGWTLGTTSGTQTLQALADGVPTVTFTATAAPGPVVQLTRVSAEVQSGTVNTLVTAPPSVRAEDQYGNPVPNVVVQFAVTLGGGSITGEQQTTSTLGIATVGSWRLGTTAGQQVLSVSATGTPGTVFGATALAGPAVGLLKIAGDNQQAVVGLPVPIVPGVRAVDAFNNPVGNVPVSFTPGPNSGTVTGATAVTDLATGAAFVGSWTLSAEPTQTLVATSSMLPGVSVTFTARATTSLYDIDVRFIGEGGSTVVRSAFTNAAAKWRQIIAGDMHNTRVTVAAGSCTTWMPAMNEVVNDVVIFARITPIDGPGKILGQAGPCFVNTGSRLSAVGIMEFDEDDMASLIANGSLTEVILHEMGHVLGIGTLWNFQRTLLVGSGGDDPYFQGTTGRAQFAAISTLAYSGNAVPVENTGAAGTRDSHWRESVLTRELMTGFLNRNVTNPLSRLTVGSLQDLGYVVNLSAADPYSITAQLRYAFPFVESDVVSLGNDIADLPLFEVSPAGTPVLVRASLRSR